MYLRLHCDHSPYIIEFLRNQLNMNESDILSNPTEINISYILIF